MVETPAPSAQPAPQRVGGSPARLLATVRVAAPVVLTAVAWVLSLTGGPGPLVAFCAVVAWLAAVPSVLPEVRLSWRSVLWLPVLAALVSAVHGGIDLSRDGTGAPFVTTTAAAALAAVTPWLVCLARDVMAARLLRMRRSLGGTATRLVEKGGARRRLTVPRAALRIGDEVLVPAGTVVPADLHVTDGEGLVSLERLSTRTAGHPVSPGDMVVAGCVPQKALVGTVVRAGQDTAISRVLTPALAALRGTSGPVLPPPDLHTRTTTEDAQLPIQRSTDLAAWWSVPVVVALAAVAGLVHGLLTDAGAGVRVATAVLLAASPAAALAAVPSALRGSILRGALLGLRMKGVHPLQSGRDIDLALVDPSSGIATGHPRLVEVRPMRGLDPDAALLAAVSVAQDGEGPIPRALESAARTRSMSPRRITDQQVRNGGLSAHIKGMEVTVGDESLFDTIPPTLRPEPDDDALVAYVGWGGRPTALLRFRDRLRPGAAEEVQRLLRADVVPHLMCAEPAAVARRMAERVGVHSSEVTGGLDDAGRAALVQEMLDEGHRVALLTRDGRDDAAVHADLVIAPTWADEQNRAIAQVETVRPEMAAIADAVSLTRHTGAVVGQNVMLVAGYHLIAVVPVVAGWVVPPAAAALALVPLVGVLVGSQRISVGTGSRI
ncbi:P-type ATPase [Kytococcus sp. Marseille-QA3725]